MNNAVKKMLSLTLSVLLAVGGIAVGTPTVYAAPTGNVITDQFPDPNFRAAVRGVLGISSGADIYDDAVAAIISLNVSSKGIQSLEGIEWFSQLKELNCSSNQLTGLDVSALTKLEVIYCYGNQLAVLDVSGLTGLKQLYCFHNQLTTLDVSGLSSLWSLDCSDNQLTALDMSGLTNLRRFLCNSNKLTTLDVSDLSDLGDFSCDDNQFTVLEVRSMTKLSAFSCNYNQLTALDVTGMTELRRLFCTYNQLTALDVTGLTKLELLDCSYNYMVNESDVQGLDPLITTNFYFYFQRQAGYAAVTDVVGLPQTAVVGTPLTLWGDVLPVNAASKELFWKIATSGTTGATIDGNIFTATGVGTAVVHALIDDGLGDGVLYVKPFTITVSATGAAPRLVQVESMGSDAVGSGYYTGGQTVAISAGTAPNHSRFVRWNAQPGVEFADVTSPDTTLVMPDSDVTVRAMFESTGGSSSNRNSSGSSSRSTVSTASAATTFTVDAVGAKTALAAMKPVDTKARITGSSSIKVLAEAWKVFGKTPVMFDTIMDKAVQVRVTVNSPANMTREMELAGVVKGSAVDGHKAFFAKWFENKVQVIHFKQSGSWGQPVEIAAKVDLAGMDVKTLVLYSYDKTTNTYKRIENPGAWVDGNGYLHFTTNLAGTIVISDGALVRK